MFKRLVNVVIPIFSLIGITTALSAISGCSNINTKPDIKPWVKPYQRHYLADPIMMLDQHPLDAGYMHHVFQAREASRGAEGGAGGGCGCN